MGYTHYWRKPATLPKKEWSKFVEEVEMLKDNLPENCITAGANYKGEPIEIAGYTEKTGYDDPEAPIYDRPAECIAFNGVGDYGHESVVIERVVKPEKASRHKKGEMIFSFCKTARKPYDTMVCLTLISMKKWFGDSVRVSTDGDQEDWQPAIELYRKLTGIPITYTMLMEPDTE